jgi:hypothetical protein
MAKKRTASASAPPQQWFVKELAGETPPSFESLQRLYSLASELYSLRPWRILEEDQLIVVRDSVSGELRFCSVMGALGEVFSMHAYMGAEGLRQFRRIEAGEFSDPGEFLASTHCIYVEFVAKAELLRQDKELLAAVKHPQGRGLASPIFRTMRPGFLPWLVNEQEARALAECIRAVNVVCSIVANEQDADFWEDPDTLPMVTCIEGGEPRFKVEMFHPVLPPEPPVAPVQLPEEVLSAVRAKDYAVRGVMELDMTYSAASIGKKNERNACAAFAIAVDAQSGMVLAPEVSDSSVAPGDMLAAVFLKAIQSSRTLPKEIRVRSQKLKDSLTPLMESFAVKVRVPSKMPASDEAKAHLLNFRG